MTLIILLYALFASSFSAGKLLLCYTTPIFLAGIRMFIAGIILLAYQYFAPFEYFKFRKKHIWYYAQITIYGIYIAYILRFWALNYLTSSKTCFLFNLMPFFSSYYSYLVFREKITQKQWIGLAIGCLGFIPILISTSPTEMKLGELFFISLPELAIIVAVAAQSYSWVIMRKLVKDKSYSPMMVNGITMACGGFLALITSFFTDGFFPVTNVAAFSGWLTFVIIVSNIICYNLYGFLLKKYTATFLSFAGFLAPIFAALYGWGLLGEKITWHFYVSGIIVLFGLILFYKEELDQQRINNIT